MRKVKRWEKMQKEVRELEELHKELFGWVGRRDATGYMLQTCPPRADYTGWVRRRKRLEGLISLYQGLLKFGGELKRVGTEYNIAFHPSPKDYGVEIGVGCEYADAITSRIPVTVREEGEVKVAQEEKFDTLTPQELIKLLLEWAEEELDKTNQHIAWLEEEVE